ncbi:MAG: hypothetical protein GKS01_19470 [Alphaproteobacteria bacterium]|nr:hypothetical protein [Alphaproteobacteria bacterium]
MSFKTFFLRPILLSFTGVLFAAAAQAAVLFSETYDADRLNGGSGVTLSGDRVGTVNAGTVSFGASTGSLVGSNLLDIGIFGAGTLNESQTFTVTVSVTGAEPTGNTDQDPVMVLQSGPSSNQQFMAVILSNDPEGAENRRTIVRTDGVMDTSGSIDLYDQSTGNQTVFPASSHDSASFVFTIGSLDGVSLVSPTASGLLPQSIFDASDSLTFRIFGHNENETYTFDAISITVEGPAIPEPNTLAIVCFGLIGVRCTRIRRTS